MGSFDHLVCELKREEAKWGDWCMKPQAYFRGETSMPGAKYHVGFQGFQADTWMEVPHFHIDAEEYILLYGANLPNIFDFDAEMDIWVGEDPDHMEMLTIKEPTVLRIPPKTWHCPIEFRIKKPVIFQATYLDGIWMKVRRNELSRPENIMDYVKDPTKGVVYAKNPDGTDQLVYEGDNVRFCVRRPGEMCTICGLCFGGLADEAAI